MASDASARIGTPGGSAERPAVFFRDAAEFRAWLEAHHETAAELWMGLNAKHVEPRGLTWAEAVPEALCFGWIDSLSQRIDGDAGAAAARAGAAEATREQRARQLADDSAAGRLIPPQRYGETPRWVERAAAAAGAASAD